MKNRIESTIEKIQSLEYGKDNAHIKRTELKALERVLEHLDRDINSSEYALSFSEALDVVMSDKMFVRKEGWNEGVYLRISNGFLVLKDMNNFMYQENFHPHTQDLVGKWKAVVAATKKALV